MKKAIRNGNFWGLIAFFNGFYYKFKIMNEKWNKNVHIIETKVLVLWKNLGKYVLKFVQRTNYFLWILSKRRIDKE